MIWKSKALLSLLVFASSFGYSQDSTTFNPGKEIKDGFFRNLFLGKGYRDVWKTDVKAPVMNPSELGLTPIETGGRFETKSLRFKDACGRTYAARGINKDLSRILPPHNRKGVMGNLLRDHASANEPYAALVVAELANHLKILHCNPKLYVLPSDTSLGSFSEEFKGMPVLLEERPTKSWVKDPKFMYADKIIDTEKLIRQRFEEGNIIVDKEMYLKGRLLDMLIGDWSRHDDQYRWALVKKDSVYIAYPIPRDRDHALFKMQGIIKKLSLVFWPYSRDFNESINKIDKLNHMAGNMDRIILPEISNETWFRVTAEFLQLIDEKAIEAALAKLPRETFAIDGKELNRKLEMRLKELPYASYEFYKQVNKNPFIPATDKKDKIEIAQAGDSVCVKISLKKSPKPYFCRTFRYPETGLVTIAALDGEDEIKLSGTKTDMRINILQGPSDDKITHSQLKDNDNILMFDTKPRKIYDYLTSGIREESKSKKHALNKVE